MHANRPAVRCGLLSKNMAILFLCTGRKHIAIQISLYTAKDWPNLKNIARGIPLNFLSFFHRSLVVKNHGYTKMYQIVFITGMNVLKIVHLQMNMVCNTILKELSRHLERSLK